MDLWCVTPHVHTGLGQVLDPVALELPRAPRTSPAGDANAGPSDFISTAAADYLLLRIVTRHDVGTSAVNGSSVSSLKAPGVFPERAAMEDLRQILVLGASTGLQHTPLVADDTAGASLQLTTTGNTPHPFAALAATHVHFNIRYAHCCLQQLGTAGRD
jgi:hypothetical protein